MIDSKDNNNWAQDGQRYWSQLVTFASAKLTDTEENPLSC
jgi:hypothetical protein